MRNTNFNIFSAADATATQTSSAIDVGQCYVASLVTNFSQNNSGTIKMQGSNDVPPNGSLTGTSGIPLFVPTNWNDIPSATNTIANATAAPVEKTSLCYRWARVIWAPSAGAGTITCNLNMQGF